MKIGHFIPAYRQEIKVGVAYSLAHDLMWAMQAGHDLQPFFADMGQIERARNWAVQHAIKTECDLLLMQDADVQAPRGALGQLYRTMQKTSAAAVGALVVCRTGESMNAEPACPGEVYDGEVGTGLLLIDLRIVRKLEAPWFQFSYSADGTAVECGEDVGFCRRLTALGHRVVVDATIATIHHNEHPLVYQPPVAVNQAGDDAPAVDKRTHGANVEKAA